MQSRCLDFTEVQFTVIAINAIVNNFFLCFGFLTLVSSFSVFGFGRELSFQCITSVELMKDVQNCVSSEFISFLKTEISDYQTKNL